MDVTELVDDVRDEVNTELSRLGSSKSLYADTEGEMEPEAVLSAMADAAYYAAETADGWTNDGDGYADAYATVASVERDHYDVIASELEAHEPGERPEALEVLRGLDGPLERLGGLLGWTLVAGEKAAQATGFFTGQADPGTASLFREFGDDYEALRGDLVEALADAAVVEDAGDAVAGGADDAEFTADPEDAETYENTAALDDADAEPAREVDADEDALAQARASAAQVIGAAYDEYVETLESLGVNPKPVC